MSCPLPGKWSLAVWSGSDDVPTGEALATCGGVTVEAAYWLDPQKQGWLRYFSGRPEFSSLLTLGTGRTMSAAPLEFCHLTPSILTVMAMAGAANRT